MPSYTRIENLCLLLYECPTGQAYIQAMLAAGIVPSRIIYMRSNPFKKTDTLCVRAVKALPLSGRMLLLAPYLRVLKNKILFNPLESAFQTLAKHTLEHELIQADTVNEPAIINRIREIPEHFVLYVAGGIVRKPMFETGKQLIHIHPGYLPHVRGGDGLLWSMLTRGNCGATCFFMREGIDTGEIIFRQEFELPKLIFPPFFALFPRLHLTVLRFVLESTYDPHLRASLLLEVLESYQKNGGLESFPQNLVEGETYHNMHPLLAGLALSHL